MKGWENHHIYLYPSIYIHISYELPLSLISSLPTSASKCVLFWSLASLKQDLGFVGADDQMVGIPSHAYLFPTISDISYKTSRWGWLSWWSSWICRKSQTFVHRHIMTYINCTIYWFVCGHYSWKTSKMRWPFLLRFQSIFFMNPLLLCFFIAFNTQATSSESTVTLSLNYQCEAPLLWL